MRMALNGKVELEENLLTWKNTGNNCHSTFLTGLYAVYKNVRCCLYCSVLVSFSSNWWDGEREPEHENGLQVLEGQMFFRSTEREKDRASKKEWRVRKVRKIKLERELEETSGEERQLQQPRANQESLGVLSSWENKKRASGPCQSRTGISHRWGEQMSH